MTLIGYIILFPSSTLSNQAKHAIELAISVFDNFGAKFSVAANAAQITRDLSANLEVLLKPIEFEQNSAIFPEDLEANSLYSAPVDLVLPSQDRFDAPLFNLFDMAVDIDFWNDVDTLFPDLDQSLQVQSEI
jgi:hypothetical protein